MAASSLSRLQRGLYWTLALAVAGAVLAAAHARAKDAQARETPAKAQAGAAASAPETDPLAEWKLINSAAVELRDKLAKRPRNGVLREQLLDLAARSAVGAERALAIANARLFESYRSQFREFFRDTRQPLLRLARRGNGRAEYASAVLLLHGFTRPADVSEACRRFSEAVDKGFLEAKFRLAQCVASDDPPRASSLMRAAAAAGNPFAAEIVARDCLEATPPDPACAWGQLSGAAAAGRPSAQSLLAWMYANGFGGREVDLSRAVDLYGKAAGAGDVSAQNNLGELYETGHGVPSDPKQAAAWYRQAAEANFAPAQFNLGRLYAAGTSVPRNLVEARRWLEIAERGGVQQARTLLEWIDRQETMK